MLFGDHLKLPVAIAFTETAFVFSQLTHTFHFHSIIIYSEWGFMKWIYQRTVFVVILPRGFQSHFENNYDLSRQQKNKTKAKKKSSKNTFNPGMFVFFLLLKEDFFHTMYYNYSFYSPNSSQILPTLPPLQIHTLSVSS